MLAIQPLRALTIDSMTFPPKLTVQLRAAPGAVGTRQLKQARLNTIIFPTLPPRSTLCVARLCHQAAGAALAKLPVVYRPCHRFAALHGR